MKWFYLVVILLAILGGCSGGSLFTQNDDEANFVKGHRRLELLTQQIKPNWSDIENEYKKITPLIKETDEKFGTNYLQEFDVAIKEASNNRDVEINRQWLLKGLQHVAILVIKSELMLLLNSPSLDERRDQFHSITELVEVIRSSIKQQDNPKLQLEKQMDELLLKMEEEVEHPSSSLLYSSQQFNNLIVQAYALNVLFEVKRLISINKNNLVQTEIKRKEVEMLYRVMQGEVMRNNYAIHEYLVKTIKGPLAEIEYQIIKDKLKNGLPLINLEV